MNICMHIFWIHIYYSDISIVCMNMLWMHICIYTPMYLCQYIYFYTYPGTLKHIWYNVHIARLLLCVHIYISGYISVDTYIFTYIYKHLHISRCSETRYNVFWRNFAGSLLQSDETRCGEMWSSYRHRYLHIHMVSVYEVHLVEATFIYERFQYMHYILYVHIYRHVYNLEVFCMKTGVSLKVDVNVYIYVCLYKYTCVYIQHAGTSLKVGGSVHLLLKHIANHIPQVNSDHYHYWCCQSRYYHQ
jgi:hypothetical protein